jgi:membrane associated rhomboid family serine protease
MSETGPQKSHEPVLNIAPVVAALIIVMAAIHALRVIVLTPELDYDVVMLAAFIPAAYGGEGGLLVWSLFTSPITYALLHGSWAHFGLNSVWLAVFGAPLAARIGAGRFLAFFAITAMAAALMHFVLHQDSINPLIGASGAVSGCTAAAARFGFSMRSQSQTGFTGPAMTLAQTLTHRTSLSFIVIWFAINAVPAFGGMGNIAWEAHIGGFIAGLLLLPLFDAPAGKKR